MCVTQLIWSVSSLPLLDHRFSVLVCLALPRAELVLLRLALRPCGRTPTGAVSRGRSRAAPPPGSRGPASPASLPPLAKLAPAMGLAGYGRAVAACGGLFLRLPPTFHNVGCRYCSESAAPAPSPRRAVLRPQRPAPLRSQSAADVLARWLPLCSSFLSLGLQWKWGSSIPTTARPHFH